MKKKKKNTSEDIARIDIPFILAFFTVKKTVIDGVVICHVDWAGINTNNIIKIFRYEKDSKGKNQ